MRVDLHHEGGGEETPADVLAEPCDGDTLAGVLAARAAREPSAVAYHLPESHGETRLTVGALYDRAGAAAATLARAGLRPGDRACLCLDTSPDLLAALYGTMLLGAVPMLVEPPMTYARRRAWADRARQIVKVAGPAVFVCDSGVRPLAEEILGTAGAVVCPPFRERATGAEVVTAAPHAPALIQFSSGTTAAPKGIVLSHRALFAAMRAIGRATPLRRDDVAVSWLPLHHDMGMVGATLTTLLFGVPAVLVSPLSFAARPKIWLDLMSRYGGTVSAAPNFAYRLVASLADRLPLDGLDLSGWRVAFNGAEVVDAATLRQWQRACGPYGFRPEAMRTCYGLAEIGLAASFSRAGATPRVEALSAAALAGRGVALPPSSAQDTRELVSSGLPVPGVGIRIVDDAGGELPDGVVGRVLVTGDSMMTGYLTENGIETYDGSLDTGDLGFTLDGELFVTGRHKDLIIIAGRNYQPQPFEQAAATVDGVRAVGVAALGLPDAGSGTERLVIVVETPLHRDAARSERLRREVERAVVGETGVRPGRVAVVRPGTLPRTSSGKLRRPLLTAMMAAESLPEEPR